MIGNDVVHLPTARKESNPFRPGWIDKVFSVSEQSFLYDCRNKEISLWTLWSIKEATYKIHQRQFKLKPIFNPKDIEVDCSSVTGGSAKSRIGGKKYSIRYQYQSECIHSIARISSEQAFTEYSNQSNLFPLCHSKQIFDKQYTIQKLEYNIPVVKCRLTGKQIPVSVSHHGTFWIAVVPLVSASYWH